MKLASSQQVLGACELHRFNRNYYKVYCANATSNLYFHFQLVRVAREASRAWFPSVLTLNCEMQPLKHFSFLKYWSNQVITFLKLIFRWHFFVQTVLQNHRCEVRHQILSTLTKSQINPVQIIRILLSFYQLQLSCLAERNREKRRCNWLSWMNLIITVILISTWINRVCVMTVLDQYLMAFILFQQ